MVARMVVPGLASGEPSGPERNGRMCIVQHGMPVACAKLTIRSKGRSGPEAYPNSW